jgi:hypothetical protein
MDYLSPFVIIVISNDLAAKWFVNFQQASTIKNNQFVFSFKQVAIGAT